MGQWTVRSQDGRTLSVATVSADNGEFIIAVDIPKHDEGGALRLDGPTVQDLRRILGLAIGDSLQGKTW